MADGKNQARALRILELINDFRMLQQRIRDLSGRYKGPPDPASGALIGYQLLRQYTMNATQLLAMTFNPPANIGNVSDTEAQRSSLRAQILDASVRRFQAHKIYLGMAAVARWIAARTQVLQGQQPSSRHAAALTQIDQRLRQEVEDSITDKRVYDDLRNMDLRKGYWIDEDPSLNTLMASVKQFQSDTSVRAAGVSNVEPTADQGEAAGLDLNA